MWLVYIIAGHFIAGFIAAIILLFQGHLVSGEKLKSILIMTLYGYMSCGLFLGSLFLDIEEWIKKRKTKDKDL